MHAVVRTFANCLAICINAHILRRRNRTLGWVEMRARVLVCVSIQSHVRTRTHPPKTQTRPENLPSLSLLLHWSLTTNSFTIRVVCQKYSNSADNTYSTPGGAQTFLACAWVVRSIKRHFVQFNCSVYNKYKPRACEHSCAFEWSCRRESDERKERSALGEI